MGIPHLITHLRPYAVAGDLTGRTVVIDGPAFAYHIFHLCLASKQSARNPFDATPSYALLEKTAIQWLDALRTRDVKLKKIFFDGYLPPSKRNVRGERLRAYTKQINTYHEAWPQVIPPKLGANTSISPVELFAPKPVPSGLSKIPAAPFLVPAIIEAIYNSPIYRELAEVVPGEADLYCARYLRQYGGTVLTSDSDLLVHELGSNGSVCFFKDILLVSTRGVMSIRSLQYDLSVITERLGLPGSHGLKSLAFEISKDVHLTFPQLIQRATKLKSVMESQIEYSEFSTQYTPLQLDSPLPSITGASDGLKVTLNGLDPRVSEYVLQFPFFAKVVHLDLEKPELRGHGRSQVEVFLPFLLDYPARTSAWEMSTTERQLSYGLLNLVVPEDERVLTVLEHRRLQSTGRGREWQLPTAEQLQEACRELLSLLAKLRERGVTMAPTTVWRTVGVYQDLKWASSLGKTSLSATLIEKARVVPLQRVSWDVIHATAQLHGSFYSFRILQQCLSIIHTLTPSTNLPDYVDKLHEEFRYLPKLSELPPIEDVMTWLTSEEAYKSLQFARSTLGIEKPTVEPSRESKATKKKRKREAPAQNDHASTKRPVNIFEVLGTE